MNQDTPSAIRKSRSPVECVESALMQRFPWRRLGRHDPETTQASEDKPPISLDPGTRAGSNTRSGESVEAVEGEINAHPGDPKSNHISIPVTQCPVEASCSIPGAYVIRGT